MQVKFILPSDRGPTSCEHVDITHVFLHEINHML